jgi:hypothetical protein
MSIVAVMLTYRLIHFTNVVLLQKLAGFIRVANILKRFGGILGTFIEKNLFTTRVLTGERVNQKKSLESDIGCESELTSSTNLLMLYTLLWIIMYRSSFVLC